MKLATSATLAFLSMTSSLFGACSDVLISEYIEGGSYNKSIELYNPTETSIDLSAYSLELYSNGSSSVSQSMGLSGMIESNSTFVISNPNAISEILNVSQLTSSTVINFNGDDAVVLRKNGEVVDSIGQVGFDPGSQWLENSVGTKDFTLVKKENVCADTDVTDVYDPSVYFDAFEKDTVVYLGSYNGSNNNGGDDSDNDIQITLIHDIQGEGSESSMINEDIAIEGIVVADYQEGGFKGFFVQEEDKDWDDNAKTSESIFVYCNSCETQVNEGDLVKVIGTVKEYSNLTEIVNPEVTVISSENQLPSVSYVSLPVLSVDDLEAYEGMLVELKGTSNDLIINENYEFGRYGSFTVASERLYQFTQLNSPSTEGNELYQNEIAKKSLVIDDGLSTQNPEELIYPAGGFSYDKTLRSGYSISSIKGIMDQRYGSYRLQPNSLTNLVVNEEINPRIQLDSNKTSYEFKKGSHNFMSNLYGYFNSLKESDLRVASFNVLNYFNTFEGCTYGVAGNSADCRGANNEEEFLRQRTKIINAMTQIDADIFGLMEIENDGYDQDSAIADLVNGLNEKIGKNTYAYVDVDSRLNSLNALGDDAIKVGFIYNKQRVNLGTTDAIVLDEYNKNRVTLAQVFNLKRKARKFLVTVNHFKSKGSSCEGIFYDGVEDLDINDGQGNCALTRVEASKRLIEGINNNKKLKEQKRVIHLGDFNSYAKENSLKVLEDDGYINALTLNNDFEKYSYVFDAQAGLLDHAFVSQKMLKRLDNSTIWHINTDEPKVLDYNTEYKSATQVDSFYGEGVFRSSDHDPVILDFKF